MVRVSLFLESEKEGGANASKRESAGEREGEDNSAFYRWFWSETVGAQSRRSTTTRWRLSIIKHILLLKAKVNPKEKIKTTGLDRNKAMRPRSRLLSKRRLLLPTIREGTEESLRDLNEGNSLQAVSSEDYLLSICHLAHPTFPARDFSTTNNHTQQFDLVDQRLRLSRLTATPSGILDLNPAGETLPIHMQQGEGKEMDAKLMFGKFDPLECLYGHKDNLAVGVRRALVQERFMGKHGSILEGQAHSRIHSIPRDSRPDLPHQCKSSFAELYTSTNISSQHSFTTLEAGRGGSADRGAEEERQNATAKQSLISRWISDCRSAWREARVQACMLPAIAEI